MMLIYTIQYILYGLIFYGGYRLLRHHVYARGGELPELHPEAFLRRYYVDPEPTEPGTTPLQRLQNWVRDSEAAERSEEITPAGLTAGAARLQKTADYPREVVVCLGDSITHGRCSDDYVQRVRTVLKQGTGSGEDLCTAAGQHRDKEMVLSQGSDPGSGHRADIKIKSQQNDIELGHCAAIKIESQQNDIESGHPEGIKIKSQRNNPDSGHHNDTGSKPGIDTVLVNAGINGDTAWNMLQRLPQVLACQPDAVTILAGTNDINAAQSTRMEQAYRRSKQVPASVELTLNGYLEAMETMLVRLREAGVARVAVFTIPMIGEVYQDPINETVRTYNHALIALCRTHSVTVLELHEAQHRIIEAMHHGDGPHNSVNAGHLAHILSVRATGRFPRLNGYDTKRVEREIKIAPWKRFILMQSWESIANRYGYYTLIDGMHLNDRGGMAAAALLAKWLTRKNSE